jgi:flagellar assembly factor FliW
MLEATEYAIVNSMLHNTQTVSPADSKSEEIETRFGKVAITRDNPLVFERGLLGIPNSREFCLTEFPSAQLGQFKLLQSLEELTLSFITLPLDPASNLLEAEDITRACEDAGIPFADAAILLIVTVHRSPTSVQLSVNARAPLLVNAVTREAVQYVFQHNKYKVQHLLDAH